MASRHPLSPEDVGIGRLFYAIAEAVVVASAVDELIYLWSPAAERMFGYTEQEAVGMPLETLVPQPLRPRHREGIRRFSSTGSGRFIGSGRALEVTGTKADGSSVEIELSLTPIRDAFPELKLVLALARDIGDRKRLETERDHFMAMVAHDIASPLSVVMGMSELLGREKLDDQVVFKLDAIRRNTERALDVARDLTEAAYIEDAGFTIEPRVFDLAELVAEGVAEASNSQPDRRFHVSAQPGLWVVADPLRTNQVLNNLVGNALKFSAGDVTVTCETRDRYGRVTVRDRGPGIERDASRRVFEKFARGRHPAGPGSGLGLYISHLLVQAQGGYIGVESEPGAGASFWFELPLAEEGH